MRIFVLGGDGFCGWPTALHLANRGHEVLIVDDLSRRRIDEELGNASLTPIRSIHERVSAWRELTGQRILFEKVDVAADYEAFRALLLAHKPAAVVHLAEQRSVPYSMRSAAHRRFTVDNNVSATHNVLAALAECKLDAHLVHLGSVGIYGYETTLGYRIPEGYLEVKVSEPQAPEAFEMLHPVNPPSVYHMTKALDQVLLAYYAKNDGIRITDLLQGIVWGTQTAETSRDERLINRFDYDAVYGTVLNRFVLQATLGHPISVYGSGGQTRAFIHIGDAVRCPPNDHGLVRSPFSGKAWASLRLIGVMYSGYGILAKEPFHPAGRNGGIFGTTQPILAKVFSMKRASTACSKSTAFRDAECAFADRANRRSAHWPRPRIWRAGR